MTNDTSTLLLIITNLVTGLLTAVLTPLFQQWLQQSQTKPIAEIVSELSVLPHEGWFMRLLNSPWVFPPSFIVLDVWWLIHNSRSRAPITRLDVYSIATMATAIFFNLFWMSLNAVRQEMRKHHALVIGVFGKITDGINRLKETVQEGIAPSPELERLRGALDNLRAESEKLRRGAKKR